MPCLGPLLDQICQRGLKQLRLHDGRLRSKGTVVRRLPASSVIKIALKSTTPPFDDAAFRVGDGSGEVGELDARNVRDDRADSRPDVEEVAGHSDDEPSVIVR